VEKYKEALENILKYVLLLTSLDLQNEIIGHCNGKLAMIGFYYMLPFYILPIHLSNPYWF
jgi:hypothetical protein